MQETLAYEADVNSTCVRKLETGATWAGLKVLVKLAMVLGVEPADFLQKPAKRGSRKTPT